MMNGFVMIHPPVDKFGTVLEVYDIIALTSANGNLDVAIIVDMIQDRGKLYPVVRRFDRNNELKTRSHLYKYSDVAAIWLSQQIVPKEIWQARKDYIELHSLDSN